MTKKKKTKKAGSFWRIVISAIGAALILLAISQLLLFFFGASAPADVTVRRVGGANDGAPPNRRYEWSVDYTFVDQHGGIHDGHTSHMGSDMSVTVDDTVRYFTFAPFINSLESDSAPGLSQLLYVGAGVFLLIVMNKKKKTKAPPVRKAVRPEDLTDYDDSVEEQFHGR